MKHFCVFCGASRGGAEHYAQAAKELGGLLVSRGLGLVYGGGNIGLMGVLADAALAAGGEVIGVIPRQLIAREVGHDGLTEMHVVDSMNERKILMAELSDGFIAMPGGLGTLDELFEMLTWSQLKLHDKPCGLFNHVGYFDSMLAFLEHGEQEGFIQAKHRAMLLVDRSAEGLLARMMGEGG